jgi:hypothetical protein
MKSGKMDLERKVKRLKKRRGMMAKEILLMFRFIEWGNYEIF